MTVDNCNISLNGGYIIKTSVLLGESIIFKCTCLNGPVKWKLNGEVIPTNTHYIINATSGTLTIPAAKSSDNGHYTCISDTVSLTVRGTYIITL